MNPEPQSSLFPEPPEAIAERVDAEISWLLLGHRGGRFDTALEPAERDVLRLLRYRRGLKSPVQIKELQQNTGLDPRQIKQAVRTLRLDFKLPIGSSKNPAATGYYVMITAEDRAAWRKDVINQIRAEVEVLRAADSDHAALEVLGQLALEVRQ